MGVLKLVKGGLGWVKKTVYNGKTESKNPREGVGGLNKDALQNAAVFLGIVGFK